MVKRTQRYAQAHMYTHRYTTSVHVTASMRKSRTCLAIHDGGLFLAIMAEMPVPVISAQISGVKNGCV